MTTSSFKLHAYDHPLPQDLSQEDCCHPPEKPHIWKDRLRNHLVKKMDASIIVGSAYNQQIQVLT